MKTDWILVGVACVFVGAFTIIVSFAFARGNEFDKKCISAGGIPYHGRNKLLCFDPTALRRV